MKKIINDDKIYKTLEKNDYYKMTTLAYDLIFKSTYYKKENPFRPYEAVQLLIKAAKNNYAGAFFYLGYLAENGIILFNSLDNAILFYKKAAELNHNHAKDALKRLNITSTSTDSSKIDYLLNNLMIEEYNTLWVKETQKRIDKNLQIAQEKQKEEEERKQKEIEDMRRKEENKKKVETLKENADKDADSCFKLAYAYFNGYLDLNKNEEKAFILFNQALQMGNFSANRYLAECYFHGKGTTKNPKKGYDILLKACKSKQADLYTYYYMALNYHFGFYKKNPRLAFKYFNKAYKLINDTTNKNTAGDICNMLGYYYHDGIKTSKNYHKSFEFFKESFEKFNFPGALINLHVCYYNGDGVGKDASKAKQYLLDAQKRKDLSDEARLVVEKKKKKYL